MGRTFLPGLRGLETKTLDSVVAEIADVESKSMFSGGPAYSSTTMIGGAGTEDRALDWDMATVIVDGYERAVWVWKSIEFISSHSSRLPFRVGKNLESDEREVLDEHPLYRVLNTRANPLETARQFRKRLSAQVYLSKRGAFIEVTRSRMGTITRLDLLSPDRCRPIPSDNGDYLSHFEYTTRWGEVKELDPERVRWVREPHPTDPFSGTTPLEPAGISIELDHLSRLYNVSFIKNDGRPGGIVGVDADGLSDQGLAMIERQFAPGVHTAGSLAVIGTGPGGVKYVDTTTRPRDMAYSETSTKAKEEILTAFGLDESVIGQVGGRTFDNAEQALYNAWTEVVVPHNDLVASVFADDVDPGWEPFIDTGSVGVLELPRRKKREEARAEVTLGARSVNEYRPLAGLDPLDEPHARALWISPSKAPIPASKDDSIALGLSAPDAETTPPAGGSAVAPPGAGPTGGAGGTAADAVAEARGEVPAATGDAAAAVVEARGSEQGGIPGDAAEAVTEARGRLEGKAANAAPKPLSFELDAAEADRLDIAVKAALDALLARQAGVIAARLESPKARKGTKFWAPDPGVPVDARAGVVPLDTVRAVDADRWAEEATNTLEPLLTAAVVAAVTAMLGGLATGGALSAAGGATAASTKAIADTAAMVAVAPVVAALSLADDAMREFLTDLEARLSVEALAALTVDTLTKAVLAHFADNSRSFVSNLGPALSYGSLNGGVEQAAQVLSPAPGSVGTAAAEIDREWASRRDDKVRPTHREVDGERGKVGEVFTVGGFPLRFPADPLAPLKETAGCRCRLRYEFDKNADFTLPSAVAAAA